MQIDVLNVQYGVTIKLQFVKKKKKKTQKISIQAYIRDMEGSVPDTAIKQTTTRKFVSQGIFLILRGKPLCFSSVSCGLVIHILC